MPPSPPSRWFVTDEPHRLGTGWVSGTLGAVLGLTALAAAACHAWPTLLTLPETRAHYPAAVRSATCAAIALAFLLGTLSLALRRKKTLGIFTLGSSLLAASLLGLEPIRTEAPPLLGLDVFALQLLLYTAVFVPLERLWPLRPEQPTFRPEWWTDLAWFASSALLVSVTTFLVLTPGNALASLVPEAITTPVRTLPLWLQVPLAVLASDVVQYHVHRACHRVPFLWRFHAIHHGAQHMDWLAGSRLHLVDAVLTRALVYAVLALLFDVRAIGIYLMFVAAQATFVHANVQWRLRWLEPWLVTPRFHHWHHGDAVADVNFAVHLPWLDRLFGTFHLPDAVWPERYGLANGVQGPRGFWRQFAAPFRR